MPVGCSEGRLWGRAEGDGVEGGTVMALPGPPSELWVRGWGGLGGQPGYGEAER